MPSIFPFFFLLYLSLPSVLFVPVDQEHQVVLLSQAYHQVPSDQVYQSIVLWIKREEIRNYYSY